MDFENLEENYKPETGNQKLWALHLWANAAEFVA
jgi:hypothetical protein